MLLGKYTYGTPVIGYEHPGVKLVVGPIGVWYSKHNTPNPLGVQPDVEIVEFDKFNK